jgi:hypothetical protein
MQQEAPAATRSHRVLLCIHSAGASEPLRIYSILAVLCPGPSTDRRGCIRTAECLSFEAMSHFVVESGVDPQHGSGGSGLKMECSDGGDPSTLEVPEPSTNLSRPDPTPPAPGLARSTRPTPFWAEPLSVSLWGSPPSSRIRLQRVVALDPQPSFTGPPVRNNTGYPAIQKTG